MYNRYGKQILNRKNYFWGNMFDATRFKLYYILDLFIKEGEKAFFTLLCPGLEPVRRTNKQSKGAAR